MTARTHNAIALASLITVTGLFPPESINLPTLIGAVVANNIGGLIPDMDTGGNYLWGLLPQGNVVGKYLRKVFYKHRTITHSLLGFYLIYEFFNWLLPLLFNGNFINYHIILVAVMVGYASHMLSDSFTEEGVPLLFPIKLAFGIPPIKKMRIKTGRWFENLVIFPATWIYVIWFVQSKYNVFLQLLKNLN